MILKLDNINKSYGKQLVLKHISLSIDEPRLIALIAPNGSGKTTLLNIICNIEKADSGNVQVNDLPNNEIAIFEEMSYMQDNTVLYNDLTGMDHIKLVQDLHSLSEEIVNNVLGKLRMVDYMNKKVKFYSLGMKQHLLFALSILPQPQVLLMDEPLNGLDPASVVRVRNILLDLYKEGTTILFSSHNLDQIDKLTNDIFFLKNNQLVSYEDIVNNESEKSYEIITNDAAKFSGNLQNKIKNIKVITNHKCIIQCTQGEMEQIPIIEEGVTIYNCQVLEVSLERVYFDLYEAYNYEVTQI